MRRGWSLHSCPVPVAGLRRLYCHSGPRERHWLGDGVLRNAKETILKRLEEYLVAVN